jgi:UDPglucose 6-dehydrogenase
MRIAMIGTGYVGLVSGVCFSDFGHEVICVDKDPAKIARLQAGEVPIYEPGLDALRPRTSPLGGLASATTCPALSLGRTPCSSLWGRPAGGATGMLTLPM